MDSDDEDDEFCFDEAETFQRSLVYQGGKLNDILAEVETKIPSLDFDEDFDDDVSHEDCHVLQCGDRLLNEDCSTKQSEKSLMLSLDQGTVTHSSQSTQTPNKDSHVLDVGDVKYSSNQSAKSFAFSPEKQTVTFSSCPTHTEEISGDKIRRSFDDENADNVKVERSQAVSVQLDFEKLQDIDFHAVQSALCNYTSSQNSSLYDTSFVELNNESQEESSESDLMGKLSDLSKDQIKASVSAKVESSDIRLKHLPCQKKKHPFENIVSTKAIHSWTQLKTHHNPEQPETVFIDLRPERKSHNETTAKHTTSIQRILGLAQQRLSSSEEDSDSELTDWHEMRTRYKENVFKEKESYEKSTGKHHEKKMTSKQRKKVTSISQRNSKCVAMEEVCVEELLGGIPNQIKPEQTNVDKSATVKRENLKRRHNNKSMFGQAEMSDNKHTNQLSDSKESREKKKSTSRNGGPTASNVLSLQEGELFTEPGQIITEPYINNYRETISREKDNVLETNDRSADNTDKCDEIQPPCEETETSNESDQRKVSVMIEGCEIEKTRVKSLDDFEETTSSDINRLVASAVRMLDEVYVTRKLEKSSCRETTVHNSILTFDEEEYVPSEEKTGVNDEKYEVNKENLYSNISTQTKDNQRGKDCFKDPIFVRELAENKEVTTTNGVNTKNVLTATEIVDYVEDNVCMRESIELLKNKKERKDEEEETRGDEWQNKTKQQPDKLNIETFQENSKRKEKHCVASLLQSQPNKRTSKEIKKLKQEIKEKIESTRPTRSANGKYPAACNTPIIYDQQSSYEPECVSLLSVGEEQFTLLLVVTLFSCGELRLKSKTSLTAINDYFALLAWLLSLGGQYNTDSSVPFSLVGMQQAYQNGKLQLFIGVQPHQDPNENNKISRKNRIKTFNKAISKYLSTHSLRSVYKKMDNVYLGDKPAVDENLFSSKMLSTYITVGQDPNAVRRLFQTKIGFFWQTVEVPDSLAMFNESSTSVTTENMVLLVQPRLYHKPSCILDLLTRVENEGCDLVGLRLAYNETFQPNYVSVVLARGSDHGLIQSKEHQHTLALAVRGPSAIAKIKAIIGSKIPVLDSPNTIPSLRSLYCTSMSEDKLFHCPSYSNQVAVLLARWFAGRIDDISSTGKTTECHSPLSDVPPALLISSTQVTFYLVCSPLVLPSFLGSLLHICSARGFSLHDIRRIHLTKRQGNNLGLSQLQQTVFSSGNNSYQSPNQSPPASSAKVAFTFESSLVCSRLPRPSTVIVLQKENGLYHAKSLVKHIYETLLEWNKKNDGNLFEENALGLYFSTTPFNEVSCKSLSEEVCLSPASSLLKQARSHCFWSNSEVEQVCVLCVATSEAFQFIGLVLKILYSDDNRIPGNWELLAIKSFPYLSLTQAREVTPLEVGDQLWETNVKCLMSTSLVSCVLRGINITQRLCDFMALFPKMSSNYGSRYTDVDWWMSRTTEVAFRQIAVLFDEKEMFCDETCRTSTKYVPLPRKKIARKSSKILSNKKHRLRPQKQEDLMNTDDSSVEYCELSVLESLLVGPRPITTIALIKPCCLLNTKNLGKIFKSICQENFKIVALRMNVLTQSEAEVVVQADEGDINENIEYLTSGASLLICLHRENAVKKFLDILGPEDPVIARNLDPFLLRGCYGVDRIHNAIHGSKSYNESLCEIRTLFPCGLCCDQTVDLEAEKIACRAFDETIGRNTERELTKRLEGFTGISHSLVSSLVQTNCLVLTQRVIYDRCGRQKIALLDVIDCLLSCNFIPVGMKMVFLTDEQIMSCLNLVALKSKKRQEMKNELSQGPCIVIALQRDNAITCFDTIVGSSSIKHRSFGDYREYILHGATENEARNLLLYFFDELSPNSAEDICTT